MIGKKRGLRAPDPDAPIRPTADYPAFLREKLAVAEVLGFDAPESDVNPILKPHQRDIVRWMVHGGRRACFAAFGLGKSVIQIEVVRLVLARAGGYGLIVAPLSVRQEFIRDAAMLGVPIRFVRRVEEMRQADYLEPVQPTIFITNYETIRDGKLDPTLFTVVSLDEASCLRGFGGTKTFREFMRLFGEVRYRFVATATPSPNEFIEILAYSAFLGVIDVGQAKTRWFRRNSEKADTLTIHKHKEQEFWLWVASWALFVQKPSDLGYSDEGYALPPLDLRWHEIPTDHERAGTEKSGQGRMFASTAIGVQNAAREKRGSLKDRMAKLMELRAEDPGAHRLLWHDLESERFAIEAAIPSAVSIYGTQDLDERERAIIDFSDGRIQELAAKPVIAGSGCNFQRHCAWAIFMGIGFKFNDLIQAVHRIRRYLQTKPVRIDFIYTEAEREVKAQLERKWAQHEEMVKQMTDIIREHGLTGASLAGSLLRTLGVERAEIVGPGYRLIRNDCVAESAALPADSVDMIVTSIPFSTQYEYTPAYEDMGHTDDDAHFFEHLGFLTPNLLRALKPGRVAAIHVKDRIVPGGLTGLGYQTLSPFSDYTLAHFRKHGFTFLGRVTIVTDVVRENNQTYRLGWTEQCKDGSRMGNGLPEYVLLFRKPPTDASNGYADEPVLKSKDRYSRSRWQVDAHGYWRSNGNRHLTPEELTALPHDAIFQRFRKHTTTNVYDFEEHVRIGEALEAKRILPTTFMLLQPASWHPDVWTDIARMRTLNGLQAAKGQEMHLCLARGSRVLTRTGYKPIQDVHVGEYVLTHKGRWRPVLAVQNTGVRPVVTVRAHGVPGLTLTPDHKLWTRRVRDIPWATGHSRRDAEKQEPTWVAAGETRGSYLNLKLPETEAPSVSSARYWWIVGRWLADGNMTTRGGAVICCGKHEVNDLVARIGEYGGNPPHDTLTAYQILLRDPGKKLRRTLRQCGHGASGKHLPAEAYTLPTEQARALLDGYLSGDGHYLPERDGWTASSVSKDLLLGMAILVQRAYGAIASIYPGRSGGPAIIQGRAVTTKQDWILRFDIPNAARHHGSPFVLNDGAWKKVRSVESAGEAETWNLRVEEDESYTAEGAIVKNCPLQFDIVDRLITRFSQAGETVLDPFGGLMTVPYCAIRLGRKGLGIELNPGYFTDGAAYCQAAVRDLTTPTLFDLDDATDQATGSAA